VADAFTKEPVHNRPSLSQHSFFEAIQKTFQVGNWAPTQFSVDLATRGGFQRQGDKGGV
jgi:hypothetical protein